MVTTGKRELKKTQPKINWQQTLFDFLLSLLGGVLLLLIDKYLI